MKGVIRVMTMEERRRLKRERQRQELLNKTLTISTYFVEVLMQNNAQQVGEKIHRALRNELGNVECEESSQAYFVYTLKDIPSKDENTENPQIVILCNEKTIEVPKLQLALSQTWDWPQKDEEVNRAKVKWVIADFNAEHLERKERIDMFNKALKAILGQLDCLAIHWNASIKVVSPEVFIKSLSNEDSPDYLYGSLNVRLFVVDQEEGEFLMDTMGLSAFGLPDIQCHFRNLNPEEVAGVLINYGYYLFEKGDVIQDGHTVQGLTEEQKWVCKHEHSMALPDRMVIRLDPGDIYQGKLGFE